VMGMLRSLAAGPGIGDAVLVHHAPAADQVIFAAELGELEARFPGLRVVTVLTGAGAPPPELELTAERLGALCPDWRDRDAWACGPAPLLDAAERSWGALADRLRTERFRPASFVEGEPGVGGTVRFARSDLDASADARTPLLEVAEAAGLAPAHSCRMGICHTCTTRLVSGCVRDLRDGRITRDEGDLVQICVSAAAGDVELDL